MTFEKPNGLAFSPGEDTLYVCDTGRYHVRAFQVEPSGTLRTGTSRVFARLDPDRPGGPDGMKVDKAGRVYVAVALGVWVFEPDGRLLGIISLPARPSNLAWCDPDGVVWQSRPLTRSIASVFELRASCPRSSPDGCKPWFAFLRNYPAFLLFVVLYWRKGLTGRFFKCLASRSSSQR